MEVIGSDIPLPAEDPEETVTETEPANEANASVSPKKSAAPAVIAAGAAAAAVGAAVVISRKKKK